MKRITFIFGLLLLAAFAGQAAKQPADYYKKAEGKKQKTLLSQLCSIISANTRVISYNNLFEDAYPYTDAVGGYLIDMYSNVKYSVNDSRINKNYSKIGQSINREHAFPQSWFDKRTPMKRVAPACQTTATTARAAWGIALRQAILAPCGSQMMNTRATLRAPISTWQLATTHKSAVG